MLDPAGDAVGDAFDGSEGCRGDRSDVETFDLHAAGRTTVVRETRHLEDVNTSMAEVLSGSVDARLVFDLR